MKNISILQFLLISLFSNSAKANVDYLCTIKNTNILRSAPTINSSRLKSLAKYTPLKKIKVISNWFQVEGIDYSGYIHESLVTNNYKCMIVLNISTPYCSTNKNDLDRPIVYRESFKIIKQEIACNYVQEKWGKKLWLSSTNIWPREHARLIIINPK